MSTKKQPKMPAALFIERILFIMTALSLVCLGIGLILTTLGRASNDPLVDRVGVYTLLVGILLAAARIFFWIAEEIVGRGLESMTKEKMFPRIVCP